jgi:hypothetical protein
VLEAPARAALMSAVIAAASLVDTVVPVMVFRLDSL